MGATLVGDGDGEVHVLHAGDGLDADDLLGGGVVDECEGDSVHLKQGQLGLSEERAAGRHLEGGDLRVGRARARTSSCRARMELTKELQMSSGRM